MVLLIVEFLLILHEYARNANIYIYVQPLKSFLIIFGYVFLLTAAVYMVRPLRNSISRLSSSYGTRIGMIISIVFIGGYLYAAVFYVTSYLIIDHIEPQIATVSWLFVRGDPVYHDLDAAAQYSMLYGPMLYMINGVFLKSFGPSIISAKLGGALSGVLGVAVIFLLLLKSSNLRVSLILTGVVVMNLFAFELVSVMIKPEPMLLLCLSLALYGATRGSKPMAIVSAAITVGIAVNLKIHAPVYFLLAMAVIYSRFGLKAFLPVVAGSAVIAIAPFVFFPQISVSNYFAWLKAMSGHGLDTVYLKINLLWLLFTLMPVILALYFRGDAWMKLKNNALYLGALLGSALVVAVIASKPGSGPHHLIPFLPGIAWLSARLLTASPGIEGQEKRRYGVRTIVLTTLVITLFFHVLLLSQDMYFRYYYQRNVPAEDIVRDLERAMKFVPYANIGMGMGEGGPYVLTFYRPVLVYSGNPYVFDFPAVYDANFAGVPFSPMLMKDMESCRTNVWLMPRGAFPFFLAVPYAMLDQKMPILQVFDRDFATMFRKHYEYMNSTTFFDIWKCKDSSAFPFRRPSPVGN